VSHLRITPARTDTPIPTNEAVDQAQAQYRDAQLALIDTMGAVSQHELLALLRSEGHVTVHRLRATRDAAQRMAERALSVLSALDACLDTCERAAGPKASQP
jgi:hypothetical protein